MLARNMGILSRCRVGYFRGVYEQLQVNVNEAAVLSVLKKCGCATQDTLCGALLLDKATMAKSAAHLEEMGYIRRIVNQSDKREKLVSLTEAGEAAVERISQEADGWEQVCFQGFSAEEKETFLRLSRRAVQNVIEDRKKEKK